MSFEKQIAEMTANLFNGWDGIENGGKSGAAATAADHKRRAEIASEEAKVIAKALGDADGLAALQILIGKTLWRSETYEERNANSADMYAIRNAERNGQRQLIFMILNMLRLARGEDQKPGGDL
jgi:hypothetical protein